MRYPCTHPVRQAAVPRGSGVMNSAEPVAWPRRVARCSAGGLRVAFTLTPAARAQTGGEASGEPPTVAPNLDAWIRIAPDGRVAVFTGKAKLGTGIRTAIAQLAAEESDVALARIDLIMSTLD